MHWPSDVTKGYTADWSVEQLREPAQKIADRIDTLMNPNVPSEKDVGWSAAGAGFSLRQSSPLNSIGERIGKVVPKVQRRRVIALAESTPSTPSRFQMFDCDRHQFDRGVFQKHVEFVSRRAVQSPTG